MKTLLLLIINIFANINPQQQFIADIDVWGNWSATFYGNEGDTDSLPFLTSEPISPFAAKLYFDWNKQGFRLELMQGEESPWNIQTTFIVHSKVTPIDEFYMLVNSTQYMYLAPDKCVYYPMGTYTAPKSIVNFVDNITLNGTDVVDGETCLVLSDSAGDKIFVRMSDMAVVRVSAPRSFFEAPPLFQFLGRASAFSWINFHNIQLGPVNSNYFKPPPINCTLVYYDFMKKILSSNDKIKTKKDVDTKPQSIAKTPKAPMKLDKTTDPAFPHLTQAFTANFEFNSTWRQDLSFSIRGTLGFDFVKSGFFLNIEKLDGDVPLFLQTSFIVTPDRDGIEILQYGKEGSCWSYIYLQWLWTYLIPQYKLPKDVSYIGDQMIDGSLANGWFLNRWEDGTNIWVRQKDNAIVYMEYRYYTIKFSNIILKVEPNRYARPPVCSELNNWSHNFASHLFWGWCFPWC